MKRWLLAAACGAVALGLLLYPLISEAVNAKYHSDIETAYTAAIEDSNADELTQQRQAAQQYNAMLSGAAITEGGASAPPLAYDQQLTVAKALEGKSFSEIARSVGMTYGAVAMSYHRTVARLRRVLGGTEHD